MNIASPRDLRRPVPALILLASCAALAWPSSARAEEHDAQFWTMLNASVPLAEDLELSAGFWTRSSEAREGIYQLHYVADLRHRLTNKVTVSVGYSHIPNYSGGALVNSENRVRQQVNAELAALGGGELSGRLRLEQRWRDDGDDLKFRLRPSIAWSADIARDLSLELRHESFINLNDTDWGPESGHDRMRHSIALERPLGGGLSGEIGYINQYIFGREDTDEVDHVLMLSIGIDL